MMLRSDMDSSYTYPDDIMSMLEGSSLLNLDVQVALVGVRHRFAALKE